MKNEGEYTLRFSKKFKRDFKRITRNQPDLQEKVRQKLLKLREDPRNQSLRSHGINHKEFGPCFSSRVTGDLRIIWDYDVNGELSLILLQFGGHDEVY